MFAIRPCARVWTWRAIGLFAACGLLLSGPANSYAGLITGNITFSGEEASSVKNGPGAQLSVLSVHKDGSESGSVSWNGKSNVTSGNTQAQTQTYTVGELMNDFGSAFSFKNNLAVVFQVKQANGQTVDLRSFSLTVWSPTGTELGALTFTPGGTNTSTAALGGKNGVASYVFNVNGAGLSSKDFNTLFGNKNNRIGLSVSQINHTNGGAESFFLIDPPDDVTSNPEPASLTLIGLGVAGLAGYGWRRRKSSLRNAV